MYTEKTQVLLQALEDKLRQLLERYQRQQAMIQQLQTDNQRLKQQAAQAHHLPSSLETAKLLPTEEEKPTGASEEKLERYIRAIDECIAHLEQLQ